MHPRFKPRVAHGIVFFDPLPLHIQAALRRQRWREIDEERAKAEAKPRPQRQRPLLPFVTLALAASAGFPSFSAEVRNGRR